MGTSTLLLGGEEEEGGCLIRRFHLYSPLDTEPLTASDRVGVSRVGSLPAGGAAVGVTVAGDVHLARGIVRSEAGVWGLLDHSVNIYKTKVNEQRNYHLEGDAGEAARGDVNTVLFHLGTVVGSQDGHVC